MIDRTPIVKQFTVTSEDLEIASIEVILAALRGLGDGTKRRVLNYVGDRVEAETNVSP